ncbi:MAG: metal ABC transporter solute-binding protein, Zn/Mn family [Actinomycetota bacterium]
MRLPVLAALAGSTLLTLSACSSNPTVTGPVDVVATTTVLGDVTERIVSCGDGSVTVLMPIGSDPHEFTPSSDQVATMVRANLVVANGLGLEEGLAQALESAEADGAQVLTIADKVDPIEFGGHGHDHGSDAKDKHAHEDEHAHGSEDPHFWLDMNRMADGAEIIGDELASMTGNEAYATCGAEVATEIRGAEAEVRALLESVPADKRILVTDHDALGYLADAYGYEVVGTVIPGGSTLGEPSSADLADLVATMRAEGVTTIFSGVGNSTAVADALAAELGDDVQIVSLYEGSLGGPGSGAESYLDMMRTNASAIATALQD